ncbi:MAG TPA: hypothetical protein VGH64_11750 [Puia sp.]|jgi:hypothetical protein
MKKSAIIFPAMMMSVATLSAQVTNVSMGQEFAELAAHQGYASNGFSAYQGYTSSQINGSQFFLPEWSSGEVITIHHEIYSQDLQFMYDKVRQELFVRKKDSAMVLLTNKDEVKSFKLKNDRGEEFTFLNSKFFDEERPEVFYQLLISDSAKLSLIKYIKTTLEKADTHDMMKVREGEINDAFVDKNTYYIVGSKGSMVPVQLKYKKLKESFAELGNNAEPYLKDHPQGVIDEDYLIAMVKELNHGSSK